MVNKFRFYYFFFIAILTLTSCRREEEQITDCFGESLLVSLKDYHSTTNIKQIDFAVNYGGDKTVFSVEWDFGDGSTATTNSKNISHTYANAGTYEVKTNILLDQGKCIVSPKKSVTVDDGKRQ